MEIHVDNIKSYVFVLLAMCGEIDKKVLLDGIGSPAYGRRAIMSLRDEAGVVTEKNVAGTTLLRLKKPAAWKIMEAFPELQSHYETITNNHQFKTSPPAAVLRDLRKGELILYAINNDINVNLLKIDYLNQRGRKKTLPTFLRRISENTQPPLQDKSNKKAEAIQSVMEHIFVSNQDKEIRRQNSYGEIVNYMLPNDVYFFSSQEVKRYKNKEQENSPTLSINTSRSFGHIIGRENSYAVYLVSEGLIKLKQETEIRYRDYLENIYRKVYGTIASEDRRNYASKGACILFCPDIESIINHIRYPGRKYKNTNLTTTVCDIYSSCYAVPLNNKTAIQKIIGLDWRNDLLLQIFTEDEIHEAEQKLKGFCDAIVNDTMAIELTSLDIKKIETSLQLLHKSREVTLLIYCEEWQREAIKKIYSPYQPQVEIKTIEIL